MYNCLNHYFVWIYLKSKRWRWSKCSRAHSYGAVSEVPAHKSGIEGSANPLWSPSFLLRPLDGVEAARGDELTTDSQRHLLVELVEFWRMRSAGFRLLSRCVAEDSPTVGVGEPLRAEVVTPQKLKLGRDSFSMKGRRETLWDGFWKKQRQKSGQIGWVVFNGQWSETPHTGHQGPSHGPSYHACYQP